MELPLLKRNITRHAWPANMRAEDLSEFQGEQEYETGPVLLRAVKQARIIFNSVVYAGWRLVKNSAPDSRYWSYYQFRFLLKSFWKHKRVDLDRSKKYLLLTDNWSCGHFHFISDVLPKLAALHDQSREYVLLLPDLPYFRSAGLSLLKKFGAEFQEIIWMAKDHYYQAPAIFMVDPIAPSGKYDPATMKFIHSKLHVNSSGANNRIFISRDRAAYRKILNEAELTAALRSHSFEICFAEELSLEAQASIFSACSVLVGLHGAGLANCVFMPPGSLLMELRRREGTTSNVGFWHLADSLGHRYAYFNGEPDSEKSIVGQGANIRVPVSAFIDELKGLL